MEFLFPVYAVLFTLVLPIGLLFWLWRTRARSRLCLATLSLLFAAALAALTTSILGLWYVVGVFWPVLYLIAFGAILVNRIRRRLPTAWLPSRAGEWALTSANILLIAVGSLIILRVVQARICPVPAINLSSPFNKGSYYVMSGGANAATNQHFPSPVGRYAVDITKLNKWGLRAAGLFPKNLYDYAIYGTDVVAPCSGEVIRTENSLPDRTPLHPDSRRQGSGGNHVVLFCQGYSVLIAHLQPGSVAVAVGAHVEAGHLLGQVGNSGNSIEPHLHIGAVRGRYLYDQPEGRLTSPMQPVPMIIRGKFLIKGDTLAAPD
jgi:hypothetical protein